MPSSDGTMKRVPNMQNSSRGGMVQKHPDIKNAALKTDVGKNILNMSPFRVILFIGRAPPLLFASIGNARWTPPGSQAASREKLY